MTGLRIIFSPHTANPAYVRQVAGVVLAAQWGVAQVVWLAQFQAAYANGLAALLVQHRVMETAYRAAKQS